MVRLLGCPVGVARSLDYPGSALWRHRLSFLGGFTKPSESRISDVACGLSRDISCLKMADNGDVCSEKPTLVGKDVNFTQKKVHVTERLQRRNDEREADIEKRKAVKEENSAAHESTDFFIENFRRTKNELEWKLDEGTDGASTLKADQLLYCDTISADIQKLQKFLTDSTLFLPPFEVQKAQAIINKLQVSVQEKRDLLVPRKKFAFKSKKKQTTDKLPTEHKPEVSQPNKTLRYIDVYECTFNDFSSQTLTKQPDELNQKDVALSKLTNCTVKLYGSPGAIHVSNLQNCQIFTGPVSGSIFIEGCKDCVFVLPCQQLRVHAAYDSQFYIHVTSRAIIEDSSRVVFAPYNWSYEGLDEHYAISGLDKARNSWDDVDDFNWLAADVHSPNWSVLDEDERVECWEA